MKNLVIDLDGVVCSYDFHELTKKYFGIPVCNELIYAYSIEEVLGVTKAEVDLMFGYECFAPPNFVDGAIEALKRFTVKGYNIEILSNRLKFMTKTELADWMDKYNIPYNDVITCDELPEYVHASVDDNPIKLLQIKDKTKVGKLILFMQPWNRKCHDIHDQFRWADGWRQVVKEINGDE